MLDIYAELFINPTRGSKDIEWARKHDGQPNGQMDNLGAKNNMSPHFMGDT